MNRYDSYKPTGIEWIGEIPEHWEVKKLKHVANLKSGNSISSNEIKEADEYPIYGGNGLRGYTSTYTHEGDFVLIGRQGALCGNINYAKGKFYASEHAVVVSLLGTNKFFWLGELLQSMNLNQYSQAAAQPGLAVERIQNLFIPVPPIGEQTAIANYLDQKTAQIDKLIANKQQLIELLKEERTAIINEALSGEGKNWEKKKLKYILTGKLQYGANEPAEFENESDPRYIRITDFGDDGKLRDDTFKSLPLEKAGEYLLQEGDILFARSGATVGKTFHFKNYKGIACFAGYLIKARVNENQVLSDFLYYYTKSGFYENWKNSIFIQATIQNIGADKYSLIEIPIPSIDEQEKVIQHIEEGLQKVNDTIDKIEVEIELISEFKTASISETITGKIKIF